MKWDWKKIKELSKNKYTKPIFFFGFYFLFFAIIIAVSSVNGNVEEDTTEKNGWDDINSNYEYLYEIQTNDYKTITLEGKTFGNKNILTKKIDSVIDSEIYEFYDEIYIKKDNIWTASNDVILVDESLDERLLNVNYLKNLIVDAELINSTINFDNSKSDVYQFGNININVKSEENTLKSIYITNQTYKILLQYRNIDEVKDFVVEK